MMDITTRLNNAKQSFVEPHDSSIKFMKYAFRDEYARIGTGKTVSAALLAMNCGKDPAKKHIAVCSGNLHKSFVD